MAMSSSSFIPAGLFNTIGQLKILSYVDVCSVALVAHDFLLTFPDEIRLVWTRGWSVIKVLFFITRYSALLAGILIIINNAVSFPPDALCNSVNNGLGVLSAVTVVGAEVILLLRTWAIWGRDRKIGMGLVGMFTVFCAVVGTFASRLVSSLQFGSTTDVSAQLTSIALKGCNLTSASDELWILYTAIMVIESVILGLTMLRVFIARKQTGHYLDTPLFRVLSRDGILYFFILFICSLINLVVVLTAPVAISHVISTLQNMLHAILASRVVLQLREAAASPLSGFTTLTSVLPLPLANTNTCSRGHPGCRSQHGASSQGVVVSVRTETETWAAMDAA